MSSSPKPAPVASALLSPGPLPELAAFPYDAISGGDTHVPRADAGGQGAAESRAREAEIRALGRQEGQADASKTFDERLARERAGLSEALAQFTRDRAAYFEKVEAEVVQLALSIARRILHREAQLDPLLLAGIVRVALEKIDGATGVTLRIHPAHSAEWWSYLRAHLDPHDLPQIVEDGALAPDRCVLETAMGTAQIGLDLQLKEIEQGFMDLLSARPASCP